MVGSATVGSSRRRKSDVHYITGLNSFGGLKVQISVTSNVHNMKGFVF